MNQITAFQRKFHLSVVATSRNDNHGGSLTKRMQHFVDGFIQQCIRHNLSAELILVEWNPPAENCSLAEVLKFPKDFGPCAVRIITVPHELHAKLQCSEGLPLFQMIAKNVGIRRALGKYVLATNIDIIFSDKVILYLKNQLKKHYLYRADRLDIPADLPNTEKFEEILAFCQTQAFRINGKNGTFIKINGKWTLHDYFAKKIKKLFKNIYLNLKKSCTSFSLDIKQSLNISYTKASLKNILSKLTPRKVLTNISIKNIIKVGSPIIKKTFILTHIFFRHLLKIAHSSVSFFYRQTKMRFTKRLHTNACGDFTLLSHDKWHELRGYPEWELYSWHIDSVLLHQANNMKIKEIDLPREMSIYHIEHNIGSGYTPEAADALFDRLARKNISYLDNNALNGIIDTMERLKKQERKIIYNNEEWGYANISLKEIWI